VRKLKQKILAILGFAMVTAIVITIFATYSYADPVDTITENQEHEECHNHYPDEHYERHYHCEEEYGDNEGFHHHHHDEIEEERYRNHGCH
jgi:hypothetical protein